ncbi:hypothetical protein niasHT_014421 [Heterodera trifolii]|uniref:Uncharacterized protein n=1 Tax=Heterodera trifolii TaxID=157864 RepID=A0ABD2LHE4_9BILA
MGGGTERREGWRRCPSIRPNPPRSISRPFRPTAARRPKGGEFVVEGVVENGFLARDLLVRIGWLCGELNLNHRRHHNTHRPRPSLMMGCRRVCTPSAAAAAADDDGDGAGRRRRRRRGSGERKRRTGRGGGGRSNLRTDGQCEEFVVLLPLLSH